MNYEEWTRSVPTAITSDWLWKVEAYPEQRGATFHEESPAYRAGQDKMDQQPLDRAELSLLLESAPLP
jgi:hypothetical protein